MPTKEIPYMTTNNSAGLFKQLSAGWTGGCVDVTILFTGTTNCIFDAGSATDAANGVPYIALASPGPITVHANPARMWFRSNAAGATTNVTAYAVY
jgi:hypothetical protein